MKIDVTEEHAVSTILSKIHNYTRHRREYTAYDAVGLVCLYMTGRSDLPSCDQHSTNTPSPEWLLSCHNAPPLFDDLSPPTLHALFQREVEDVLYSLPGFG